MEPSAQMGAEEYAGALSVQWAVTVYTVELLVVGEYTEEPSVQLFEEVGVSGCHGLPARLGAAFVPRYPNFSAVAAASGRYERPARLGAAFVPRYPNFSAVAATSGRYERPARPDTQLDSRY